MLDPLQQKLAWIRSLGEVVWSGTRSLRAFQQIDPQVIAPQVNQKQKLVERGVVEVQASRKAVLVVPSCRSCSVQCSARLQDTDDRVATRACRVLCGGRRCSQGMRS